MYQWLCLNKHPIQMHQCLHLYHAQWIHNDLMDEVPQLVWVLDLLLFNVLVVKQQIHLMQMVGMFVQYVDVLRHFKFCLPSYFS
jgi:hypothetical protein